MFAYPLPSIPTHFQPILIENQSNPIGIDPTSETTLKTNFPSSDRGHPKSDLLHAINEQGPYILDAHRGLTAPVKPHEAKFEAVRRPTTDFGGIAEAGQPNSEFREHSRSSPFVWLFNSTC